MMNMNDINLFASSISTNSMPNIIHILLVEHDSRDHGAIMNILHSFSYRVTSVSLVSTALSILSKGKVHFDLVLLNINTPEASGLQLVQLAAKMKLLVILMSNVEDEVRSMRALEEGAFLCITKPLSMEVVGNFWQFVRSEKSRRPKETQPLANLIERHNNINSQAGRQFHNFVLESNPNLHCINNNTNFEQNQHHGLSSLYRTKTGYDRARCKRKKWTEWTVDLHLKFMAAAKYLGQGRCYPKDILEVMNVPGLTRMQVASHLQKCRHAKWLPPSDQRKPTPEVSNEDKTSKKARRQHRAKTLRFGLMPFCEEEQKQKQHSDDDSHQTTHQCYDALMDLQEPCKTNDAVADAPIQNMTPALEMGHAADQCPQISNTPFLDADIDMISNFDDQFDNALAHFLPNLMPEDPLIKPVPGMFDDVPHCQQPLDMDFDQAWQSFMLGADENDQVMYSAADANNLWPL